MGKTEEPVHWMERASVGVPQLDRDHRILMDLINQFHEAWAGQRDRATIESVLDILQEYCDRHFAAEEALMAEIGYPGLDDHRREHVIFRDEIMGFRYRACFDDPVALYITLYAFLSNWWREHILEYDQGYADYLAVQRRDP